MAYFTIEELTKLMEAAACLGVGLELEENDFSMKIEASCQAAAPVAPPPPVAHTAPATEPAAAPQAKTVDAANAVKSPLVGTFYAAAAPDKPPFVTPGKAVKKGDVLFIVESMKLMNEVLCERDGIVKEILVENGEALEYGQPVLILE